MKQRLSWLPTIVVGLAMLTSGSKKTASQPELSSVIAVVTVEQLLKSPEQYSGKHIRVRGYWVRGFEWSRLCRDPQDRKSSIWVEPFFLHTRDDLFSQFQEQLDKAEIDEAAAKNGQWRVDITCEGVFEHGQAYGHMNGYASKLTIQRVIYLKALAARQ